MSTLNPFARFVREFDHLLGDSAAENEIVRQGTLLLGQLIATDDWLAPQYRVAHPQHYQQYLLHLDAQARFSVVSFVWGPGQSTPIHNHTVWGLIGMLAGAEIGQSYVLDTDGRPIAAGEPIRLDVGHVDAVSPEIGDIHRVSNAYADRVSISIHVYGADIGKTERNVFTEEGQRKPFISGYALPVFSRS
jgi:predicted metal-dependent enzyme (double-stranded beta helix superfamily)